MDDSDPLDLDDSGEDNLVKVKGAIVRTDFSDEPAWESFLSAVNTAELEGYAQLSAAASGQEDNEEDAEGSDDEEEDEGGEDGSDVSTEEDWEGDEWLNEANDEDGEI